MSIASADAVAELLVRLVGPEPASKRPPASAERVRRRAGDDGFARIRTTEIRIGRQGGAR